MGVPKNNGTPKSSIFIGFSIVNHPFWGPTPIFGNTQLNIYKHETTTTHHHHPTNQPTTTTFPSKRHTRLQRFSTVWLLHVNVVSTAFAGPQGTKIGVAHFEKADPEVLGVEKMEMYDDLCKYIYIYIYNKHICIYYTPIIIYIWISWFIDLLQRSIILYHPFHPNTSQSVTRNSSRVILQPLFCCILRAASILVLIATKQCCNQLMFLKTSQTRFFKVTSFGPIAVTFSGLILSDLHLGDQSGSL